MKYFVGIIIIIAMGFFSYSFLYDDNKDLNPQFEKQITTSLNLHFINSDTLYKNTTFLRVFNDTLVGYKSNENPDSAFYFIQSLKNLKYRLQIHNGKHITCTDCVTEIQLFKDGCLYFPKFGGSTMFKLCSDGSVTQFFTNQGDKLFYANKILFYKNKTIITSFNGVFVFDTDSQKLLWSYKYRLNFGISQVIGNKLVFTFNDESDTITRKIKAVIQCLNLDNLRTLWKKTMNTGPVLASDGLGEGKPSHNILHNDNNEILIPTTGCLSVLDLTNGSTKFEYKRFFRGLFVMDFDDVYFSDSQSLMCFSIKKKIEKWRINADVFICGSYKSKIVAQTFDHQNYLIVDKTMGKLENQITNPFLKNINIIFMENYVLLKSKNLYN